MNARLINEIRCLESRPAIPSVYCPTRFSHVEESKECLAFVKWDRSAIVVKTVTLLTVKTKIHFYLKEIRSRERQQKCLSLCVCWGGVVIYGLFKYAVSKLYYVELNNGMFNENEFAKDMEEEVLA